MKKYRIINYISVIALSISIISSALFYSQLPDQIPVHFSAEGQADEYAQKSNLWVIPLVQFLLCYGICQLGKYLKLVNNKKTNKDLIVAQKVSKILLLLISLSFSYINVQVILTAFKKSQGLGSWFIFVFMFSMIFLPMLAFRDTRKH